MKKKETQTLSKAEKIKLVNAKYSFKNIKSVELEDLNYREKLYLLATFRVLTDEKFNKIIPLKNEISVKVLSPSNDMDLGIIDCLNSKKIILVDPNSKLDAFQFNDNECIGFNIDEVSWFVNISNNSETRLKLDRCYSLIEANLTNLFPVTIEARNQVFAFTMSLALNEVKNYLLFKSKELSYEYKMGKKTNTYIYQLFNTLSVAEIYNIIDRSIDEDYLFNSRITPDLRCYGNTVATQLLELGELANRNELSLTKSPRKEHLQRSELSRVFYDLIHDGNDEGFTMSPVKFWSATLGFSYTADS